MRGCATKRVRGHKRPCHTSKSELGFVSVVAENKLQHVFKDSNLRCYNERLCFKSTVS
jgi:hypothetical protein